MNQSDLQQIDQLLQRRLKGSATKADLRDFATRKDLSGFATKNDLARFATKDDLRSLATKDDIQNLRKEFKLDLDQLLADIVEAVDKSKADREEVKQLEKRVTTIENSLQLPLK